MYRGEVVRTTSQGSDLVVHKHELGYEGRKTTSFIVWTVITPHCNCQTFCVANFAALLNYDNWVDILKAIIKGTGKNMKRQLNIDINQNKVSTVKDFFSDDVVFEQNYISTNGTRMCMMLIKTNKLV